MSSGTHTHEYRLSTGASLDSARLGVPLLELLPPPRRLVVLPVDHVRIDFLSSPCAYCFYLDRDADPYKELPARRMTLDTLERLVDSYLFYSYPQSSFIFQGGEPTLAGLPFFEKLIEFQKQYGRRGQQVSNALQTNGILLDHNWCTLFREYDWFLGISLDGPEAVHNVYRYNKQGRGTSTRVMETVELLQKTGVPFNILCVVSRANATDGKGLYRFFKGLGIDNLQFYRANLQSRKNYGVFDNRGRSSD